MPSEPNANTLVSIYWVLAALVGLISFIAMLKRLETWTQQQILRTVSPAMSEAVSSAVKTAFQEHAKEEKAWRDEERKEWRDSLDGLRKEFRDLERDLRSQLRNLEKDLQQLNRPSLRKEDLEKLEGIRAYSDRLNALERLIKGPPDGDSA
jgi:biopolymer transport protein ExbB/TolQ